LAPTQEGSSRCHHHEGDHEVNDNTKTILKFLALLALTPIGIIWGAYALTVLWGWFVMPVFGLAPLGLAHAAGLAVLTSFVVRHVPEKATSTSHAVGVMLLHPLFALAIGWVITLFI
jgi:hypothetical protein